MDGLKAFDMSFFIKNNNWEVKSSYATRTNFTDKCCPNPFAHIMYSIVLGRIRSFYSYMLVLPGATMALLLPVMFLLPVGRPEKFNLGECLPHSLSIKIINFGGLTVYHYLYQYKFLVFNCVLHQVVPSLSV